MDTVHPIGRRCGICRLYESADSAEIPLLKPCRCPSWFHESCLIFSVCRFEANHPGRSPTCAFCFVSFKIEPRKNEFVVLYEVYNYILFEGLCEIFSDLHQVVVTEIFYALFGMYVLSLACGPREAVDMVSSFHPWKAWAICRYAIPWALLYICYPPWDEVLLQILRKASWIPIIGWFMPTYDPTTDVTVETPSFHQYLVSALLLPLYSKVAGALLFPAQPTLTSFLMGGAVFSCLTTGLRMYYKQKLYARRISLDVQDYEP